MSVSRSIVVSLGDLPWETQLVLEKQIRPVANCNLPISPDEACDHLDGFGERASFVARVKDANHVILCVPEKMRNHKVGILASRLRMMPGINEVTVGTFNGRLKIGDTIDVPAPEHPKPVRVIIGCADTRSTRGLGRLVQDPTSVFRFVGAGIGEEGSSKKGTPERAFSHYVISRALAMGGTKTPIIVTHDDCAGYPEGNQKRRIKRIQGTIPQITKHLNCICHAHVTNGGVLVTKNRLSLV